MKSKMKDRKFKYEICVNGTRLAVFPDAINLHMVFDSEQSFYFIDGVGSKRLKQWWEDVQAGKVVKKRLEVILRYRSGDTLTRWSVISAYPVCYKPSGSDVPYGITKLEFAYRSVEKQDLQNLELLLQ